MTLKNLPDQIPIFPLTGAVLLPKSHLPLNIFEPRYKEMFETARDSDGIIGMIQPQGTSITADIDDNDLFGTASRGRGLYSVGCTGLITEMQKNDGDQYFVILTGVRRFEVIEELPLRNSFREVRVSYSNYQYDSDDALQNSAKTKARFFEIMTEYLAKLKMNIDLTAFEEIGDEELINSMAMICPFDAAEKQLLIEIPTLDQRAELMMKIIDFNLAKHNISSDSKLH